MKYNALFEYVIRTSGENTDDIDDFDDRDNFWAPVPENLLFEQVLREAESQFDPNNLPIVTIEINMDEYKLFGQIKNSKTKNEKEILLNELKNHYKSIFTKNTYTINDLSKIRVELVNTGIIHCLNQDENYYLWPAIRYLSSIIKIAFHTTEPSQHITNPNTTRGNIAHIFYCKGNYIFKKSEGETEELGTHILRITAITFKKGTQNNFRHITKYNENQKFINTKLLSIEFQ